MGVVSRVRGGEQRGVCSALRSIGPLSVLHALGTDRRGSVARRSVECGRLLVGAAHAGWRQPRVSPTRGGHAPVAPVGSASWLAVHRGRGCVCDSRRDLARACSRPRLLRPVATRATGARAAHGVRDRLDIGGSGALRASSAEPSDVRQRPCRVSPGAASWSCQSHSRRNWRLRRAHRLRALAVPDPLAARAGARRLPRDLLRRAADGCPDRSGGR